VDEAGQHVLEGCVGEDGTVRLRLGLDLDGARLRFRYNDSGGEDWQAIGADLDATVLSDEHAEDLVGGQIRSLGFTGAFLGLWAWDLDGHGHPVDFDEACYTAHIGS
jgi:xylan 1,4-beta-xylosidase